MRLTISITASIILALAGVFALYNALYCAWLTATHVTPERLRTVQWFFFIYLIAAGLFFAGSVYFFLRAIGDKPNKRKRGFDMIDEQ